MATRRSAAHTNLKVILMKTYFLHGLLFFILTFSNSSLAAELIINLSNQEKAGTLMLAIYNNAEAFEGSVVKEKRSEVGVFKGLELYGNKKLDKNFLGIPKEQYGFSNNAMGTLSAPTFKQAKFNLAGKTIQNIKLK